MKKIALVLFLTSFSAHAQQNQVTCASDRMGGFPALASIEATDSMRILKLRASRPFWRADLICDTLTDRCTGFSGGSEVKGQIFRSGGQISRVEVDGVIFDCPAGEITLP